MNYRPKLYQVAVTDAGNYRAEVIAYSPDEAAFIARTVVEEAFNPAPGITIRQRRVDATAIEADDQPAQLHGLNRLTHRTLKLLAHAREMEEFAAYATDNPRNRDPDGGSLSDIPVPEVVR